MLETLVICGDARMQLTSAKTLWLTLSGEDANVRLRLADIDRRMMAKLPDVLVDLIEVAAYVYCADQMVGRGGSAGRSLGADWRRDLRFVIPVRDPDLWASPEVSGKLVRLLGFMSDDNFRFEFVRAHEPPRAESYFDFGDSNARGGVTDEVVLFSGGLDSLTGAVDQLVTGSSRLFLLSHQSSTKIAARQRLLAGELALRFPGRVLHVPVTVTKRGVESIETTQRTRSFLFGALSAAVAAMAGRHEFSFFENGIVSFNLPIAAQVVGTAATRTTHPRVQRDLGCFLSALVGSNKSVNNPYLWLTKTEVAARLKELGHADLARVSISCSHVYGITRQHSHCGRCSQCLDRRFGTLAADLGDDDPAGIYETELFTGARDREFDRMTAESFVRHALELTQMNERNFVSRFAGELTRAANCVRGMSADAVVQAAFQMHQRHGRSVISILKAGYGFYGLHLATEALPSNSILRLVASSGGVVLPPHRQDRPKSDDDATTNFQLSSRVRLAIDVRNRTLLVDGLPPLSGAATFDLVHALVSRRNDEIDRRRAPENYEYLRAKMLAADLGIMEETLRRRVLRARKVLAREFEKCAGLTLPGDAVIESVAWKGYRLNPSVVILASDEINLQPSHVLARDTSRLPAEA